MDLIDDGKPGANDPEFSVSEITGAVKRVIEGEFGHVRVRGEVSRVSRPSSGHLYFDLKDDRSVLASVAWKGVAGRLAVRPEEGMEVIATGRLTTFGPQSKYQLSVEQLALAGQGALLAMLERRRKALEAEGLFAAGRKRPIPWLPGVVGVVTSPSGAVIRDILHRLRDRFPRTVVIWPVTVQGEKCAAEVAAAIRGFNALPAGGVVPRPDVLIVARGGGSIEDLWGFNEEIVVRAAAESAIPLISAVGHETDTTLIDLAADVRAPTPTAAAEMAVPVRADLLAHAGALEERRRRAAVRLLAQHRTRLADLSRALPRPQALVSDRAQRLDLMAQRLASALERGVARRRQALTALGFGPATLRHRLALARGALGAGVARLKAAPARGLDRAAQRLAAAAARLAPVPGRWQAQVAQDRRALALVVRRGRVSAVQQMAALAARLDAQAKVLSAVGYDATLRRGFAVVRGAGDRVLPSRAAAAAESSLEIQFADGRLRLKGEGPARARAKDNPQGSLF
jgi:exodeoxyribonuclease VII large subunit